MVGVESSKVINPNFDNDFYYIDGVRQYKTEVDTIWDEDEWTVPSTIPADNPRRYIYKEYESITKIPKPLNIKSDAPFSKVYIPNTAKVFKYVPETMFRMSRTLPFTSLSRKYVYINDKLICKKEVPSYISSEEVISRIAIDTIWENPEEIIGYYGQTDNQDLDLPFPNEMFNFVLADLLKVEFNIVPKDTEIDKK